MQNPALSTRERKSQGGVHKSRQTENQSTIGLYQSNNNWVGFCRSFKTCKRNSSTQIRPSLLNYLQEFDNLSVYWDQEICLIQFIVIYGIWEEGKVERAEDPMRLEEILVA